MDGGRNEITGGSPKIEHELLPAFAKGCPHTPRNFESFSERFFFANPEFDFNACRLDDDMGVVDTTYSTTVTTATQ